MSRRVLTGGLACVLAMGAGAYGDVVSAPITFSGPGNVLTASGTVLGSLTLSGSGGMYTWDNVGKVWVGETFTVPSQVVAIQSSPALLSLGSSPVGTMTVEIDDSTYAVGQITGVNINLASGGLAFNLAPTSILVNLDAGGSTTIGVGGSGAFSPVMWNGPLTVTAGAAADVSASAGPIPLGYLFNASVQETLANNVVTSFNITPGIGPWYKFGVQASADFENISLNLADNGAFSMNTYSGSQYPYYALTLNYGLSGCASLCDVQASLSGTGLIPEPTTLALLAVAPVALRMIRRKR
jgi:hypothetical protein